MSWKRRIAEPAVMVLATVLLFEGALRVFPGLIPTHWLLRFPAPIRHSIARRLGLQTSLDLNYLPRRYGGHPHANWVYLPDATVTYDFKDRNSVNRLKMDRMGFCNPPGAYDFPSIDVLSIGDSFTWCMTVLPEQTWTAHLSRVSGLTAYNLGLPARGVEEYVELLEEYGLRKRPKVVFLMIYGGNDLRDALKNADFRAASTSAGTARAPKEGDGCYNPAARFCKTKAKLEALPLLGRSYSLNTALSGLTGVFHHRAKRRGDFDSVNFRYTVSLGDGTKVLYNPENADQDEPRFARLVAEKGIDASLFEGSLSRFQALAKEHGFAPIVVYCPSVYGAYRDSVAFQDPGLHRLMLDFDSAQSGFFSEQARKRGITFVDLTPHFRRIAREREVSELLYFPTNVHLTQFGHREVGKVLELELVRLGLGVGSGASE